MRVGVAQDLLNVGASLPQILAKGGWAKTDKVIRYVEKAHCMSTLRLWCYKKSNHWSTTISDMDAPNVPSLGHFNLIASPEPFPPTVMNMYLK